MAEEESEVHRASGDLAWTPGFSEGQPEWALAGHPGGPQVEEERVGAPLAQSRDIKGRWWKDGVPHSLAASFDSEAAGLRAPSVGAEDPRDKQATPGQAEHRQPRAGASALEHG